MKRLLTIAVILTTLLGTSTFVYAKIHMADLDVWTNGQDQSIAFWVAVFDTVRRPPNSVTSMIVTAPDATTFDLMANFWWFDAGGGFYSGGKYASDFLTSTIPSGVYTVEVQDAQGTTIIATDEVTVNFLSTPRIRYPQDGSTVSSLTPTLRWRPVPGAEGYRIHLWRDSWDEPIWWWGGKRMYSNANRLKIEKGVLWSGFTYRVQIQARDSLKDTDNRTSSPWVYFSAP
jgi:hypothetical protein